MCIGIGVRRCLLKIQKYMTVASKLRWGVKTSVMSPKLIATSKYGICFFDILSTFFSNALTTFDAGSGRKNVRFATVYKTTWDEVMKIVARMKSLGNKKVALLRMTANKR
jgi:biopolymer transport protein ExbD